MPQGIGPVLSLGKSIADNSFGSNLDILNLELAIPLFSSCATKKLIGAKLKRVANLKGLANIISRNHLKGNLYNSLAEGLLLGDKVIQERTG